MTLRYDYTDVLEVDPDTYSAWTPRLQVVEDAAIKQANMLGAVESDDANNIETYCKYRILLEINGDQLTSGLLSYYKSVLSSLEEGFRYGFS